VAAPARGQRNQSGELHEILQNAFDWSCEHLHSFFAFALLAFYLLKQQRSGPKFYSRAFVSIVLLISCSVTTAFGTLSCIKNVVFPQRLTQPPTADALSGCHREAARFYLFGTTVRCCTVPDFETEAVNVNLSPSSSLNDHYGFAFDFHFVRRSSSERW
jgi:hypothetical protein